MAIANHTQKPIFIMYLSKKKRNMILFLCIINVKFCSNSAANLIPKSSQSKDMQDIYSSLSQLFNSVGMDYGRIAQLLGIKTEILATLINDFDSNDPSQTLKNLNNNL